MGACNPAGIARALVRACDEVIAEHGFQRDDAAVVLIVHQLAYLCGSAEVDKGNNYHRLTTECQTKARELGAGDLALEHELTPDYKLRGYVDAQGNMHEPGAGFRPARLITLDEGAGGNE
jgi:hypothetical protein